MLFYGGAKMTSNTITVVLMTYNQEKYIKQSLDSILCQQISVDFDILVHDDCSEDKTYEILSEYQRKYPNKIKIIHQETRKFLIDGFNMMIYKYVVPNINSKFIAYCDGDDYWCDPLKLKKQYEFMRSNPDYSMCFHSAYQLMQNNEFSSKWFIGKEGDIDMSDLINDKPGVCVATSSIFLKSEIFKDFSDWRKAFSVEDVPMYMTAAIHGKIHRLPDVMCVYRQFSTGSWSSQNRESNERLISHRKKMIENIKYFDKETNFKYHNLVLKKIEECNFSIASLEENYKVVFSKENKRFVKRMPFKIRFALKLKYKHPKLYNLIKRK